MTAHDILPYTAAGGGSDNTSDYPLTASASFSEGEPVTLAAAGGVGEAADNPESIIGIAAVRSTDADGTAQTTGTPITVYRTTDTQQFWSQNFATDGAGTAATPTQANAIGESAGLDLSGGVWTVDTGKGNLLVRIDDVIDIHGFSIADPRTPFGTANAVVFTFIWNGLSQGA